MKQNTSFKLFEKVLISFILKSVYQVVILVEN
jgi:hypothetical protein